MCLLDCFPDRMIHYIIPLLGSPNVLSLPKPFFTFLFFLFLFPFSPFFLAHGQAQGYLAVMDAEDPPRPAWHRCPLLYRNQDTIIVMKSDTISTRPKSLYANPGGLGTY